MTIRRVLITGITGQDGTYLAELLAAEGCHIHGFVRPGDPGVDRLVQLVPDAVLFDGDLGSLEDIERALTLCSPAEVYHLAGATSVAQSWHQQSFVVDLNGTGTVRMIEALQRHDRKNGSNSRLLVASSSEMFGHPDSTPQDESTPIRPTSPYGAGKALGHMMAQIARSQGQFVSTVILYNHESPRRPDTFVSRKITKAVARIATGDTAPLELGNLASQRDWGFAGDYVRAMRSALRADQPDDFIVATGVSNSIEDFARSAFAAVGVTDWQSHVIVSEALLRPDDVPSFVGDATKARTVLGWEPEVSFEGLVSMMVEADLKLRDQTVARS